MLTNPPRLSGLRLEPAVSEEVVLVTAPGARGIQPFYTVAELCRTPLLVTSGFRTVIDEQLRKLGLKLAPGIELDSVEGIRRMVVKGLAPTLMPASAFQDDIRAGRLDAFHIADAKLHRLLMIASPAASRQPPTANRITPAMQQVIDVLVRLFATLSEEGVFNLPPREPNRSASARARRAGPRRALG